MSTADREISATRVLDAPRELVWKVWTDPSHIAHWWGPNGFTNTIIEMSVKPGGVWRFIMHGPDGIDYPNEITYLEIEKPSLLVYDHGPSPHFHVTVRFEEEGRNRTRLQMTLLFETAEERTQVVEKYGAVEGLNQTLGRLAEYLSKETQS